MMKKISVLFFSCVLFIFQAYGEEAILITGGQGDTAKSTTELYLPSSDVSCSLPQLPDARRAHTVEASGTICGDLLVSNTCLQWRPDTGSWERSLRLDVLRNNHVSWTPSPRHGTYLMGGIESAMTTTLITPEGTQEEGFSLRYETRYACAIDDRDTETVVITGGNPDTDTVSVYNLYGWQQDLSPLNIGRRHHACSSFTTSGNKIFFVTGGLRDDLILDSTELYDPNLGSWVVAEARLPTPGYGLRAANINDRILIFGGRDYAAYFDTIQEYDTEIDTIMPVSYTLEERAFSAISVVKAEDFTQWCN